MRLLPALLMFFTEYLAFGIYISENMLKAGIQNKFNVIRSGDRGNLVLGHVGMRLMISVTFV